MRSTREILKLLDQLRPLTKSSQLGDVRLLSSARKASPPSASSAATRIAVTEEGVATAVAEHRRVLEAAVSSLQQQESSVDSWIDPVRGLSYSYKRYRDLEADVDTVSRALEGKGLTAEMIDHIALLNEEQKKVAVERLGGDPSALDAPQPMSAPLYRVLVLVKSFEADLADKAATHLRLLSDLADLPPPDIRTPAVDRNLMSINKSPFKHKKHQEQWWLETHARAVSYRVPTARATRFLLHLVRQSKLLGCQLDVHVDFPGSLYADKGEGETAAA